MTTLKVRIESLDETLANVAAAWNAAASGSDMEPDGVLALGSWNAVHRLFTPKRLAIVHAMTGQGPLSIREVARRVGRDFKTVHSDVDLLLRNGVIDKSGREIVFPYDRIHVEFDIGVAA